MTIMRLAIAPNKILSQKSESIKDDEFGEELKYILESMAETMYANSGLGLAAVQVGLGKRILVADIGQEYGKSLIKMINPEVMASSSEKSIAKEGCLSMPMLHEDIERSKTVVVKYFDIEKNEHVDTFSGIVSHIIQHEIDHFDGITILDKISRLKKNMYIKKLSKVKKSIERNTKFN